MSTKQSENDTLSTPSLALDAGASEQRGTRIALIGLVLLILFGGYARSRLLAESSPYVLHEDELIATRRGARMMETGDWNPRFFRYPSLTIYLTAVAFGTGHILQGEAPSAETGELEPTYERPKIGLAPRYMLIGLSLATLIFVGYLARSAFGSAALLFLAPLALSLSPRFLMMSWTYVNVDLVGAFICSGALALLFATRHRESWMTRACLPGLLTGLAVGAKYYLGLVGLPAACVILAARRKHFARNALIIVVMTLVGFLISTPYSLLDPEFFVEQVQREMEHYSSGHKGAEAEAGLAQVSYYLGRTWVEFGWGPCLFGLIGIVAGLRQKPRETALLLAFPLALLLFLSTQRVHFIRNFLSVYTLFPVFIAFGCLASWRTLLSFLPKSGTGARVFACALVLVAFILSAPRSRIRGSYGAAPDSRNRAVAWIEADRSPGSIVYVADELMLDTRRLEEDFEVKRGALAELSLTSLSRQAKQQSTSVVLVVPQLNANAARDDLARRPSSRAERKLTVLFRAGSKRVPRDKKRLLHLGDPELEIRQLLAP